MKTMCPPGYAHHASVTFEHSVCRRSLMTTYIIYNIYNIMQYIYICIYAFVLIITMYNACVIYKYSNKSGNE